MTTPKPKRVKLTPVDKKQCQANIQINNFMSMGGFIRQERCKNLPLYIAKENKPGEDGRRGSMSLCDSCVDNLLRQFPVDYATLTLINENKIAQNKTTKENQAPQQA